MHRSVLYTEVSFIHYRREGGREGRREGGGRETPIIFSFSYSLHRALPVLGREESSAASGCLFSNLRASLLDDIYLTLVCGTQRVREGGGGGGGGGKKGRGERGQKGCYLSTQMTDDTFSTLVAVGPPRKVDIFAAIMKIQYDIITSIQTAWLRVNLLSLQIQSPSLCTTGTPLAGFTPDVDDILRQRSVRLVQHRCRCRFGGLQMEFQPVGGEYP